MPEPIRDDRPGTDPRFGWIQQQLAAQDKVMAQMSDGIRAIERTVSETAVSLALSVQDRNQIRQALQELKVWQEHAIERMDGQEHRLQRGELLDKIQLAALTLIGVPTLLTFIAFIAGLGWMLLVHKATLTIP